MDLCFDPNRGETSVRDDGLLLEIIIWMIISAIISFTIPCLNVSVNNIVRGTIEGISCDHMNWIYCPCIIA